MKKTSFAIIAALALFSAAAMAQDQSGISAQSQPAFDVKPAAPAAQPASATPVNTEATAPASQTAPAAQTAQAAPKTKVPYQVGKDAKSKTDTLQTFHPHWFIQLQDGINYSCNTGSFQNLITNNIELGAGYNFTPVLGARLLLGYTAGSNSYRNMGTETNYLYYRYKYYSAYLDGTINISNIISSYRHDRFVDVFPYVGVGLLIGTDNLSTDTAREAAALYPQLFPNQWPAGTPFFSLRGGVYARMNLTEHASITMDLNLDGENSKIASLNSSNPQLHLNLLVGIMFRLTPKTIVYTRSEAVASASESAEAAAAALAAANMAAFDGNMYADQLEKAALLADGAAANAKDASNVAYEAYRYNEQEATVKAADEAVIAGGAAVIAAGKARTKAQEVRVASAAVNESADQAKSAAAAANAAASAQPFDKSAAIYASREAEAAAAAANAATEAAGKVVTDVPVVAANTLSAAEAANEAAKRALEAAKLPVFVKPIEENVFFALDKSIIRKGEPQETVDAVLAWLTKYPEAEIDLVGYASKESGGDVHNLWLSKTRVNAVKKALTKAGISSKRIHTDYKGDRVQPFEINEQNRVVTCRMHTEKSK